MGLLRKIMIETRNRLEDREEKDGIIMQKLFEYLPESTEHVFIYVSVGSEAGTHGIIRRLLGEGRKVYCPKVIDRDLAFFEIRSFEDLKEGYQGIPEPKVNELSEVEDILYREAVCPSEDGSDIMIIPGVTFDEEGNRMGYGAGMYDRFLMKHPVFKLALAYEAQVYYKPLDEQDEFDVPMDMLITEKKVRDWSLA